MRSTTRAAAVDANQDFFMLRFRRDSRLMIVLGAPKEDDAREGAAFYGSDGRFGDGGCSAQGRLPSQLERADPPCEAGRTATSTLPMA